jgi:hypothetical protein
MSTPIPLTAHTHLSLSSARLGKLMDSDPRQATALNVFDRFIDLFRPHSKQVALKNLHQMLHDGGSSNFARFNLLSQLAAPDSQSLFTLSITAHPEAPDRHRIEYCINGQPIKADTIDSHEKDTICRHMGKPLDTSILQEQVSTIDRHRRSTEELVAQVRDADFSGGGVNKKFHAQSGLLRAENQTGTQDFERELALAEYAQDRPELASYISTQKKITDPRCLHPELSSAHAYAVVDVYDAKHVSSHEMDQCIDALSREQARSLLPQLVDMARVLYKNQIAHRDLHMHNLVVHEIKETGSVHLKAIDFGRMEMGEDFAARKFEDIDYLFDKQGATLLETFGRNHLARAGSQVDRKHYPIHKLCEKFNAKGMALEPVLSRMGAHLKFDLRHAGSNEALVDAAFHKASQSLQLSFAQLQPDTEGIRFA